MTVSPFPFLDKASQTHERECLLPFHAPFIELLHPLNIMKTSIYHHLFVFFVVSGITGCGSGLVNLRGTVTFSDDGSPLTTGFVIFDNGKDRARGKIKEDGTYTVGSLSDTDGLKPGHYRVYVQAIGPDPSGALAPMNTSAPSPGMASISDANVPRLRQQVVLVDSKFSSADTSGLECNVDKSTKTYNIVVERNPLVKVDSNSKQ